MQGEPMTDETPRHARLLLDSLIRWFR